MTAARRLIRINAANLKNNHLYVTGLRDLFPPEAIGGPRRKGNNGHGKARGFLRCRGNRLRIPRPRAAEFFAGIGLVRLREALQLDVSAWRRKGGMSSSPTTSIRTRPPCTGTTGRTMIISFYGLPL